MKNWINHHLAALILLLLVYVSLWLVVAFLIARFGGWRTLAARFRLQGGFTGPRWSWQSAQMCGSAVYNNCLIVGADNAGLFIGTVFFFRFAHPALYLPWAEITVQPREILWGGFLGRLTELRLGRTEQVRFRINLAPRPPATTGRWRELAAEIGSLRHAVMVQWQIIFLASQGMPTGLQ